MSTGEHAAQERLLELRDEINAINESMRALLERRLAISAEIAEQKRRLNRSIHDPVREAEILSRMMRDTVHPEAVKAMFELLFELSKTIQYER